MLDRGGLSAADTFLVTVHPVNDAPALTGLTPLSILEDDSLLVSVSAWAGALTDPDDAFGAHQWVISPTKHLVVKKSREAFTILPVENWNGTDTLRVTVSDAGGLTASTSLIVHVKSVNDPVVLQRLSADTMAYTDILFTLPVKGHDPDSPTP